MWKSLKRIYLILFYSILTVLPLSCDYISPLNIYNIRIFKDTPVWRLAKAVKSENTNKIKKILEKHPEYAKFPEGFNGFEDTPSLLMWSIANNKYKSFQVLLEMGSDPNLKTIKKKTPLMYAGDFLVDNTTNPQFTIDLLKAGADANYSFNGYLDESRYYVYGDSPLRNACRSGNLEIIKALVDNGADINLSICNPDKGKCYSLSTPLTDAFGFHRVGDLEYLIIEKKADIKRSFGENRQGEILDICYYINDLKWYFEGRESEISRILQYIESQGIHCE
jgi:hypothetical protein